VCLNLGQSIVTLLFLVFILVFVEYERLTVDSLNLVIGTMVKTD